MNRQSDGVKNEAGTCGPGCSCNCESAGVGKRAKWLISGAVMLAACAVTAAKISGAKEADPKAQGFALPVVAVNAAAPAATGGAGWEVPLKGMRELNVVATNTEAVFLVIPSDDAARTEARQAVAPVSVSIRIIRTGAIQQSMNCYRWQHTRKLWPLARPDSTITV